MAQISHGIRSLLKSPLLYELFQNALGADSYRKRFVREFIRPFDKARILDIGCGTAKILNYLPETVEYLGVDANPKYIADASSVYKGRAQFICGDAGNGLPSLQQGHFDIILAMGILHHLEDEEAVNLFQGVYRHLKDDGVAVTVDSVYTKDQSPMARYIISKDRGQNTRTPEGYLRLAAGCFPSVKQYIVSDFLRIPYTHIIMRSGKSEGI